MGFENAFLARDNNKFHFIFLLFISIGSILPYSCGNGHAFEQIDLSLIKVLGLNHCPNH